MGDEMTTDGGGQTAVGQDEADRLASVPADGQSVLRLHELICRCPKCRGNVRKERLCSVCAKAQAEIERLEKAGESGTQEGRNGGAA
jgi:ligand-binding sensor protein